MSKLFEIVITHWNEPWEIVKPGIMMLSVQRRVDWENIGVTIIHDGTDKFPAELLSCLPFTVNQVCIPHSGISAARNYAIDHCDATWIKFCDCDDTFAGIYSISCIIEVLANSSRHDMLMFPFVFDPYFGNQVVVDGSPVFIHDKIFRRSFLIQNNLRFNEELTFSEDFAFNSIMKTVIDSTRVGKIESNFPIYVWVQRRDGVANRPEFWLKNRIGLFDAHRYVEQEFKKRGFNKDADSLVGRTIAEVYAALSSADNSIDTSGFVRDALEYYHNNKERMDSLTNDDWDFIIKVTNEQNLTNITKDDVYNWIASFEKGTEDDGEDK